MVIPNISSVISLYDIDTLLPITPFSLALCKVVKNSCKSSLSTLQIHIPFKNTILLFLLILVIGVPFLIVFLIYLVVNDCIFCAFNFFNFHKLFSNPWIYIIAILLFPFNYFVPSLLFDNIIVHSYEKIIKYFILSQ